jgi:hypothetical protein
MSLSAPPWETLRIESEAPTEADANIQLAASEEEEEEEEEELLYPESSEKHPTPDITLKQDLPVGDPESLAASTWRHGAIHKCTQQLKDALQHIIGLFMYLI